MASFDARAAFNEGRVHESHYAAATSRVALELTKFRQLFFLQGMEQRDVFSTRHVLSLRKARSQIENEKITPGADVHVSTQAQGG